MDIKNTNELNRIYSKEVSAEKKENSNSTSVAKQKKIDGSAQKALESYGRAAISFGKSSVSNADKNEIKKLLNLKKRIKDCIGEHRISLAYYNDIPKSINEDNKDIAVLLINDVSYDKYGFRIDDSAICDILNQTKPDNKEFIYKLIQDNSLNKNGRFRYRGNDIARNLKYFKKENIDIFNALYNDNTKDHNDNYRINGLTIGPILSFTKPENEDILLLLINDTSKENSGFLRFDGIDICDIISEITPENKDIVKSLINDKTKDNDGNYIFNGETIRNIAPYISHSNLDLIKLLINEIDNNDNLKSDIESFQNTITNSNNINHFDLLMNAFKNGEINLPSLCAIINNNDKISVKDIQLLKSKLGESIFNKFTEKDIVIGIKFKDLFNKNNINEISQKSKKEIIRNLVASNTGMFEISDELRQHIPLLPQNQEEYCELLPNLVKSLGIETNELSQSDIDNTYSEINKLSDALKTLSDEEFNKLSINQEYSSDDLIKDTFNIVKDLSDNERQKVFDYFGFELYENPNGTKIDDDSEKFFSINGYPVNLNNGKKLAQINEPSTKAAVEKLRPYVIKFSQNNKITSNNKEVENYLNNIISSFPELRKTINSEQHPTHNFNLFKHSLKVMQKITQNPDFEKLNNSDKNLLLLASLFHDITKPEGFVDKTHPNESAFDTYYILKKLKLPKDDEIKLYSLIKHHEWFAFVDNKNIKSQDESEKRFQSAAFDLQYDNLFDLAKIFTIADLKAVKGDDSFFNKFKFDFEPACNKISSYITQLQTTQPLLPVTPIPKASTIDKAITKVNADGSTNFKGIYKNKDGLVIIKFNEVENKTWEKIGFPKGSFSHGITVNKLFSGSTENINTGNIKFFAHGLDYPNQLTKFDAFALPDSDALLSVSYTERPESKYRFFRKQGVLLNTPTKYMHGGGNTDCGSGCSKDINTFKKHYIFGGLREDDRKYISNLIKDVLNLSDKKYIQFVKQNADKPFSEIQPEKVRNKIIKAFSLINSNTRKGNRAYNEMYITNPEVMGVFAYSFNDSVGEVIPFVDKQKDFLKTYALQHDLPFVVFGN